VGSLALMHEGLGSSWEEARAVMFTVLVTAHLLYAFVARLPTRGLRSNPWLLAAVGAGLLLQAVVVLWPPAHELFGTTELPPAGWAVVLVAGTLPVVAMAAMERPFRR